MVNFIYLDETKSEFKPHRGHICNQSDLVPHFSRGVAYTALYSPKEPAIAGVFRYLRSMEICVRCGNEI